MKFYEVVYNVSSMFMGIGSEKNVQKGAYFASEGLMRELFKVSLLGLVLLLAGIIITVSSAGAVTEPLDESQQLFFSQFRYAVQAHDSGQLIRLTHPQSKECVSEEDRDFYYGRMLDGLVRVLGNRQTVQSVMVSMFEPGEIIISKELQSGENVKWPVAPEARLIVEYEKGKQNSVASLYLSKDKNEWKWVHICFD